MPQSNITLRSSDGKLFKAPQGLRKDSQVLRDLFNQLPNEVTQNEPIPVDSIDASTLSLLVGWYESRNHRQREQTWEQENMPLGKESLFGLVMAANYLEIDFLLQWSCKRVADMIRENSLDSLGGLPDEVQLVISNQLSSYTLLEAVKAGTIPTTPYLEQRVQHTHTWASILAREDFAYLHKKFDDIGNAFLIGYDLKRLHGTFFQQATDRTPIRLLLTWLPEREGPKLRDDLITPDHYCKFGKIYETHYIPRSQVTLTIRQCRGLGVDLEDLGDFIQKDNLKTNIIYFKGDVSLHQVSLSMDKHDPVDGTVYSMPVNTSNICNNSFRDLNLSFRVPHEKGPRWRVPWHMR
jgi:S-phase kinase-associated protein 1